MENKLKVETIMGEVVGKANNYMSVPVRKGSNERRLIKNDKIRAYERSFMKQCKVYRDANINTQFTFYVKVFFSDCSHDLDNALKTLLDCCQYAKCITNDNLCVKIIAHKCIDRRNPRVMFAIEPIQTKIEFL